MLSSQVNEPSRLFSGTVFSDRILRDSGSTLRPTEEDKLRRQIARLEAENAYLKKLRDLRNQGPA